MNDFKEFGLPSLLVNSLSDAGINKPTPIQEQTIPVALEGSDILASAQTGSGKTLAYLLPIITNILKTPTKKAIILAPTRELAIQVRTTFNKLFAHRPPFGSALLIGGDPIFRQFDQLKKSPRLIIGTPGRVIDHLKRRSLQLNECAFLVIDEMDRMLDMGFSEQLDEIVQFLPKSRQTMMFSATMPSDIIRLSQKYLENPKRISVGSTHQPALLIKQDTIHTSAAEKLSHLLKEIDKREGSIIVFVKTKRGAEQLASTLKNSNHKAAAIHGDLMQRKRDRVMKAFRDRSNRIMVATDIAARGLDVPHIQHVINYDLPQCPEDYIHRIGRTGRAGAEGFALSLISPEDSRKWKAIHKLIHGSEEKKEQRNNNKPPRKKFGSKFKPNQNFKSDKNFTFKNRKKKPRPQNRTEA